jgi:exodeoxyribonuclease V
MLKNHIEALLRENLRFPATDCQSRLITGLSDYISSSGSKVIILIKGFAGTGKTTMISALTRSLSSVNIYPVLLAPTGRAAKVMSGYTDMPAFTIHKKIYRQQSSSDGMGRFILDRNIHKNTYFIVDEASMISNKNLENSIFGSGRLLDDLFEFISSGINCRLILVGDTAQLPPVGINMSPALDVSALSSYGVKVIEYELTDVVRQASDSGILSCATQIRKTISKRMNTGFFKLNIDSSTDVVRISGEDLVESITMCYEKYGLFETTVVTRSNKRANLYNQGIRDSILFREDQINRGDILMVVKNNYYWKDDTQKLDFIANGDIAEVVKIYGYEKVYGFHFADVCLRFIDYEDVETDCKIFLDTLSIETASFSSDQNRQLFESVAEDYTDIKNKRDRWEKIRNNPYFNALQVKYAYALTCHKAQGGQWKAVFIDHGYLIENMLDNEYYRWLYTAFTRSVEKLFLINFRPEFFK